MDIRDIHKDIFEYLYILKDDGLLFMPRLRNNQNRLEEGYYFIGNEDYLQVSFWDTRDQKEKVHAIGFIVDKEGKSSIQLAARDQEDRRQAFEELVEALNQKFKLSFKSSKKDGLWLGEFESLDYLDNLEYFLKNYKPFIDDYLKDGDLVKFIDKEKCNKAVDRIYGIYSGI